MKIVLISFGSETGELRLTRSQSPHAGTKWVKSRTKFIGLNWEEINNFVAILNVGAYHSKSVPDISVLASLPSSRATLEWAQTVLFKEAIAGNRIVICMRSARLWGLAPGKRYGKGLFCSEYNTLWTYDEWSIEKSDCGGGDEEAGVCAAKGLIALSPFPIGFVVSLRPPPQGIRSLGEPHTCPSRNAPSKSASSSSPRSR